MIEVLIDDSIIEYTEKGTDFGEFELVKANATVLPISKLTKFEAIKK